VLLIGLSGQRSFKVIESGTISIDRVRFPIRVL